MRFVTVTRPGGARAGIIVGDRIHLLPPGETLLGLLGDDGERLHAAGERALREPRGTLELAVAPLCAPIPQPPTIRDFMTFEQHVQGAAMLMGDGRIGQEWYDMPVFYFTNPYAVVGPYDDVAVPPGSRVFDFELEVAAVVGRAGRNLTVADAERHIVGYMILNDWSARDLQTREMRAHLGPAKGKDSATTLGPALVTADELAPFRSGPSFDLGMSVAVNDVVVGTDRLTQMAWSFGEMASYASRGTWVRPGDILGSGACGGGCLAELWGRRGRDAMAPIGPGDVVTMTVEQLGTIRNRVVPGAAPHPLAARSRTPVSAA
ncbi:MAG TPA: fumarylacetoacetate hydrolase family protein [Micromonosporaceae bacterium]|nr:fumarylacetoacetate hydrolase family protein [Micromonosporaceae bacterium]